MTEEKDVMTENTTANASPGSVKIANDVVATIAGLAAVDVPGVAGMSGGIVGGIAEMLGRKNFSKGVKVEVGEKEAYVEAYIIVDYGVKISEVAQNVQKSVKNAVETMTGLEAKAVNVYVQGVVFPTEKQNKPEKEEE